MAKFLYRMQNILDIKTKLEESAKQEYSEARRLLNEEEEKLNKLYDRRNRYLDEYQRSLVGVLDFLEIDELSKAIVVIDDMVKKQNDVIKKRSKDVEYAKIKLNTVMQERKMHEKLKEKDFEQFISDMNAEEAKATDEIVSYKFGNYDD